MVRRGLNECPIASVPRAQLLACVAAWLVALSNTWCVGGEDRRQLDVATVNTWVNQLGSSSHRERERSTQQLLSAGRVAIPALIAGLESDDREVYRRSSYVLRQLLRSSDLETAAEARDGLKQRRDAGNDRLAQRADMVLAQHTRHMLQQFVELGARVTTDPTGTPKAIHLGRASISDQDLQWLLHLEQLEELDLRFTPITDHGLSYFAHLRSLKVLNLQGTAITDEGLPVLASFPQLESLSVERTAVTDEGLQHLAGLKHLSTLYLGGSQVTGPGLVHLEDLQHLTYLSFQHSEFTDEGVPYILRLKHIATLGLDNTRVTDQCLSHLVEYASLRELWLTDAPLDNDSLVHLKKMKQLTAIYLNGTSITPEGLYELSLALPNTIIQPTPPKERKKLEGNLPGLSTTPTESGTRNSPSGISDTF